MDITNRIKTYQAIEEYRSRPLITYATSTRAGVPGVISSDTVREFIDQINEIDEGESIDILLHSAGGDALSAWKLMSVIRERFRDVSVLVPFMSFSAATIFSLGANEIVMHPYASLGPIDPQISVATQGDTTRRFFI